MSNQLHCLTNTNVMVGVQARTPRLRKSRLFTNRRAVFVSAAGRAAETRLNLSPDRMPNDF